MKIILGGFYSENLYKLIWDYDPYTYKAVCNFQQNVLENGNKHRLIESLQNKHWPGLVILDDELVIEDLRVFIQGSNIEVLDAYNQEKIDLSFDKPLPPKEVDALSSSKDRVRIISDKPLHGSPSFFSTSPPKPGTSMSMEYIRGLSIDELIDRENREENRDTFIHLNSDFTALVNDELADINRFPLHTEASFAKMTVCNTNTRLYPIKRDLMIQLTELFDSYINPAFTKMISHHASMKKRETRDALAVFFNKTILLIMRAKPQYQEPREQWVKRVNDTLLLRLRVLIDDKIKIDDLRENNEPLKPVLRDGLSSLKLYFKDHPIQRKTIASLLNGMPKLIFQMGSLEYKNQKMHNKGGTMDKLIKEEKDIYECTPFVKIIKTALKTGRADGPIEEISVALTQKTRDALKALLFDFIRRLGGFGDLPDGGSTFEDEKKLLSNWAGRLASYNSFYLLPNTFERFPPFITTIVTDYPDLSTPELQETFIQIAKANFIEQMNRYLATMFAIPLREAGVARTPSPPIPSSSSSGMPEARRDDEAEAASSSGVSHTPGKSS